MLIEVGQQKQMISFRMQFMNMPILPVISHPEQQLNFMNVIQIIFYKLQNNLMHLLILN